LDDLRSVLMEMRRILWIGFDVRGGVALAAGGFIMTAAVYIFRLQSRTSSRWPPTLPTSMSWKGN
jgi:hypothetical protein